MGRIGARVVPGVPLAHHNWLNIYEVYMRFLYEVPPQLQSKLLIPMLNERSKSLLAKLPKERLDTYT